MSEGLEVLDAINEALCDDNGRPLQNIRIRHTILLDDPFPDPPQLAEHIPDASPEPVYAAVRNKCACPCLLRPKGRQIATSAPTGSTAQLRVRNAWCRMKIS